jgi:tetratricopeptide (TPR) repeat protein
MMAYAGRLDAAVDLTKRSLEAAKRTGIGYLVSLGWANVGASYLHISEQLHPRMIDAHERALASMDQPLGQVYAAMSYCELGFGALAIDKPERALELFEAGMTTQSAPIRICRPHLLVGSTLAHLALGQPERAAEAARGAREATREATMNVYEPWLAWADAHVSVGFEKPDAAEAFDQAEEAMRTAGMMHYAWRSALEASKLYQKAGDAVRARERLAAARACVQDILNEVRDPGIKEMYRKDSERRFAAVEMG